MSRFPFAFGATTPPLSNIGRGQRQMRMLSAIVILALTLVYALVVVALGADHLWRLLVFFPLIAAAGGYLEARTSTCVTLAMGSQCSLEDNFSVWRVVQGDKIQDAERAAALRRKGYGLVVQMFAFALVVTALFYFLPA